MEERSMKHINPLILAAFTLAALSCSKEAQDAPEKVGGKGLVPMTVSATGADTKTYVDGTSIVWEDSDNLAIFDGTDKQVFSISNIAGKKADFSGVVTEGSTDFYAVYPADYASALNAGVLTATLPAAQVIPAGKNVAHGAMVSVGKVAADKSLGLKNVFSYLTVEVTRDDIQSIVLNGTNLAGEATFDAEGALKSVTSGVSTVTVTYAGGSFPTGKYYIPVLPGTTAAGAFSVSMTALNGENADWCAEKVATNAVTLKKNEGLAFGELDTKVDWYFNIHDAASLERFRTLVSAGTFPTDGVAKFTESFAVADGNELADADGTFTGSLIGNNNTLTWTANGKPLFKTLNGEVSLLNIAGTVVPTVDGMFGTIAETVGTDGVIDGCKNYANGVVSVSKITAWTRIGMLAGFSQGIIKNSENHGALQVTVTGNASNHVGEDGGTWIGGIAGQFDASGLTDKVAMKACVNKGPVALTINGTSANNYMFVGGITGGTTAHAVADAAEEVGSIDGCYNYESVSLTLKNGGSMDDNAGTGGSANYSNVGGIAGYVEGNVTNCYNGTDADHSNAKVSAFYPTNEEAQCASRPAVGGIAGYVLRNTSDSYNYGNVSVKGTFAGGGVGNPGNGVSNEVSLGGIVGQAGPSSDADLYSISNCHNYGALDLVGWMSYSNGTGFNYGSIVGFSAIDLTNCTNNAAMTVNSKGAYNRIGGIVGNTTANLSSLVNNGSLTINLKRTSAGSVDSYKQLMQEIFVGGIVGKISAGKNMSSLSNAGDVTITVESADDLAFSSASKHLSVGGVTGYLNSATALSKFSNSGDITLNSNQALTKNVILGGVVGWFESTTSTLTDFSNSGNLENNISTSGEVNVAGITTLIQAATFSGTTSNSGNITNNGSSTAASGENMHIGGLIGVIQGTKLNGTAGSYITNSGNVTNTGSSPWQTIGGVVAHANSSAAASVTYCKNTGKVSTTGGNTGTASNLVVGGVIARTNQAITFNNLVNGDESAKNDAIKGAVEINAASTVSSRMLIAGCVAYTSCSYNASVAGMKNYGTVSIKGQESKYTYGSYHYVGGIYSTDNSGNGITMNGAQNYGNITVEPTLQLQLGGITAYTGGAGSMVNNYCECDITIGNTKRATYVGGIMGYSAKGTYTGNTFKGRITTGANSSALVGGIIGGSGNVEPAVNGQHVQAVLSVGTGVKAGLISAGNNQGSGNKVYTIGTDANPTTIYAGSSVNGTTITSTNYKDYLLGGAGSLGTPVTTYTLYSETSL